MRPIQSQIVITDLQGDKPLGSETIHLQVPGRTAAARIRAIFGALVAKVEQPKKETEDENDLEVKEHTSHHGRKSKKTSNGD